MSIRWRLAKFIVSKPIMPVPFDGEDGVFVYYRKGALSWTLKADTFRLKSSSSPGKLDLHDIERPTYHPGRTFTRFVGTLSG